MQTLVTPLNRLGCAPRAVPRPIVLFNTPRHYFAACKPGSWRVGAREAHLVMSSAAAVLAVVRAAAPSFRSPQDQLAFAVHAAVLTSGYRLVAVGEQAQLEGLAADAPDADTAGWNSSSEQYSFAYLSEDASTDPSQAAASSSPVKLLLKSLVLGDTLLTTLATDTTTAEPKVLELAVGDYVITPEASGSSGSAPAAPPAGSIAKTYKNLDQLAKTLTTALSELVSAARSGATAGNPSQKKQKMSGQAGAEAGGSGSGGVSGQGSRQPEPHQPDEEYDPLRIGPPRRPLRVGQDDIMPILGGGGGIGGGMVPGGPPLLGPTGGGMHVGPGHPFFADRMRHPELMPGRGLGGGGLPAGPGGVRWDPINPEGLEGWRPEDFQRPRPGQGPGRGGGGLGPRPPLNPDLDPDIGLPGPGRGADWDNMFG